MKRLACILIAIMFPLVCSGDGWFYTGAGGGCDTVCDPASNEVGNRSDGPDAGTVAVGASLASLFSPDCSGYMTTAYVWQGNTAMNGPVKLLVYLDDGDNTPDSGDTLVGASNSITGSGTSQWFNEAMIDLCDQLSTENDYWLVIAVDDNASLGWRYGYSSSSGGTAYTDTTGDYYDSEPANMGSGEWGSSTTRQVSVYVTLN